MPSISVDSEVWAELQRRAEPLVDTPNAVLRRIFSLEQRPTSKGHQNQAVLAKSRTESNAHRTPETEFFVPILKILAEARGRVRVEDVIRKLEEKMGTRLTAHDFETIRSGQIRWENTVKFARKHMIDRFNPPLLNPDSGHGWWEITEAGRDYQASH